MEIPPDVLDSVVKEMTSKKNLFLDVNHITPPIPPAEEKPIALNYLKLTDELINEMRIIFSDGDNSTDKLNKPTKELKDLVIFCLDRFPGDKKYEIDKLEYNVEGKWYGREDDTIIVPPDILENVLGRFIFNLGSKEIYRIDPNQGKIYKDVRDIRENPSVSDEKKKTLKIPRLHASHEYLMDNGDYVFIPGSYVGLSAIFVRKDTTQTIKINKERKTIIRPRDYSRLSIIVDIYQKKLMK